MWIQNVSMSDIVKGNHRHDDLDHTVLIQIQDFGSWQFAKPQHQEKFHKIHRFRFEDCEEEYQSSIQNDQAAELAKILQEALTNGHNVLVHCHAGICRSGAVAEVGTIIGFDEPDRDRIPNLLVKHKIMKALGLTYDTDEIRSDDPRMWDRWQNFEMRKM